MAASDAYARFVRDVWRRVERKTGYTPWLLGAGQIACYCPACLDGTVTLAFLQHPEPHFIGTCSNGCTASQIGQALYPRKTLA